MSMQYGYAGFIGLSVDPIGSEKYNSETVLENRVLCYSAYIDRTEERTRKDRVEWRRE